MKRSRGIKTIAPRQVAHGAAADDARFSDALFKNANRCNYTRLVYQQLLAVVWRRRSEEEPYFKVFAAGPLQRR